MSNIRNGPGSKKVNIDGESHQINSEIEPRHKLALSAGTLIMMVKETKMLSRNSIIICTIRSKFEVLKNV